MAEPAASPAPRTQRKNTPFLKQKKWKAQQAAAKSSSSPSPASPLSFANAVKWLLIALIANFVLSRMITETWLWTYEGKWANPRTYYRIRPRKDRLFTETELSRYDGSDPSLPVLLGLDGIVFDVSANRLTYGRHGAYNHFAGRDAARAFVTGCFKTHLTHDTRGFTQDQRNSLNGWKHFYSEHAQYHRVGRVLHEPIDPLSPVPPDCNAKEEGGAA